MTTAGCRSTSVRAATSTEKDVSNPAVDFHGQRCAKEIHRSVFRKTTRRVGPLFLDGVEFSTLEGDYVLSVGCGAALTLHCLETL